MKKIETITAIDQLRNAVNYFNGKAESVVQRFRSVNDLMKVYKYETDKDFSEMIGDEKIYHAEKINIMLGYKVYSTNQTVVRGVVSKH